MNREQYCKFLINGLSFHQKNVRFCTTLQMGPVISEYKETPEDLAKKIINLRENIQNNIIDNKIPTECENCIYRKQENYNTNKITQIYIIGTIAMAAVFIVPTGMKQKENIVIKRRKVIIKYIKH